MKVFFQFTFHSLRSSVENIQRTVDSRLRTLSAVEAWLVCSLQFASGSFYVKFLKVLLPVYCILLGCQLSNAQIFPVQVTPQLVPPYSFKLSDYRTTTSERLFLNLLLTDTQESNRRVRLKLYFEGQGLNVQSADIISGAAPIFLDGGVNQRLTNLDLRPYFALNNLVGITSQQYGSILPEGRYDVCFEVFDYFSGQPISRKSCTSVFLTLNEPPLLNLPDRGDLVTALTPQNIIFNWTPRHLNAPGVQYEFTLKELWDTGMDPQAAFLASPVLRQTTTFAPTLLHGPADIQLLEGKTYGWQVRAFSGDGISETALFRNNGLSEIYHFVYQADCEPPRFLLSEATNTRVVDISWQNSDHLRYRVQYRKKGYGEDDWFGVWTQDTSVTIRNLEADTKYEFRVGGECTLNGGLAFSAVHEFTTPTTEDMAYYNCGIPPEIEIANQDPSQNLGVNEVFTAGDFPVTVQAVSGSSGRFSGQGFITVPYLGIARIAVGFDNILVNTDYQMVEGMVVTEYDPTWGNIGDVDQAIEDVLMTLNQLLEMLASIGIDSTTRENIKSLTEMLVQQAQEELPQPIADKIQTATDRMNLAKEEYDAAIESGNQELADQAENEFKEAQQDLKDAEKEREEFLKVFGSIIKDALKEIVRESDDNLNNGLNQFGAENITVEETGENFELNSTDLDQLSNVLQPKVSATNEEELIGHFEYERWSILSFIATNLQTDEGTQELGNLLENEGEKLGVYIYNRLEEGTKEGDLVLEIKELIINTLTEKIALATKLF